ncbi:hypothetical protein NS355_07870 [Sphingomonas yabuuchiae]|uniref:Uncharacterized protein n=1 Tax=Sphingomonas yabuuchiae TaxID=172044 RepID=A0A147ITY0_9SPHN|nr:hypothetical protein NS355_07870 [Sphingomonas yabuuchiae]
MIARIIINTDAISSNVRGCFKFIVLNRRANHLAHLKRRHGAPLSADKIGSLEIEAVINIVVEVVILNHRVHRIRSLRMRAEWLWLPVSD